LIGTTEYFGLNDRFTSKYWQSDQKSML